VNRSLLFQNIPIITIERQTVKPGNAPQGIAFRVPLIENFKFYINLALRMQPPFIAEMKAPNSFLKFFC
jgi:hypothetical protein